MLRNINNKDFIYFDIKTGNAIKEWLDGHNPTTNEINTKEFLDAFSSRLNRLHSTKPKFSISIHDHYEFFKMANIKMSKYHQDKYKYLVNKYKNDKLVLSHNDLSSDNLLWDKTENKVHLIDYEWSRLNSVYWDVANFIRETKLSKKSIAYLATINKLKLNILKDFVYICINFAYQWTFAMPQTKKIITYRKQLFSKLQKYL
jgi:thiamine kinase-like enzyme